MANIFSKGQVVRLKSGGAHMTVKHGNDFRDGEEVSDPDGAPVQVYYFNLAGELLEKPIWPWCLDLVSDAEDGKPARRGRPRKDEAEPAEEAAV